MSSGSHGRGSSLSIPQPVTVTVHHLEIVHVAGDIVTLRIDCSSGFYVRSLAHDLGERLGTGAHLAALRRTRSGEFTLEHAVALAEAERDPEALPARMLPTDRLLGSLPGLSVTREGARRVAHGRSLGPADFTDPEALAAFGLAPGTGAVRLLDDEGRLLAIAGPGGTPGVLHPRVVLG